MFTNLINTLKKQGKIILLLSIFILNDNLFSQEIDIVPYLKKIEEGKIEEVKKDFASLQISNSKNIYQRGIAKEDPSLLFLEGVLKEDADDAVKIYSSLINKYPKSKYADACISRLYSYYYAIGSYQTAQKYLDKLEKDYPDSPYLKSIENIYSLNKNEIKISSEDQGFKSTTNKNYLYTIQVGAFVNISNAKELLADLISDGYEAEVKEKIVGGSSFNIVYLGKFFSKVEAEKLLPEIKTKYEIQGRVVPIEN